MRSIPTGGRPGPSALGYSGSMTATNSAHGTTRFISLRNCSRRVGLRYCSSVTSANICWCLRCASRSVLRYP